jgi:Uma2 family endonuclease
MAALLTPPVHQVVLSGVSWETYQRLLAEHQDKNGTRFTYNEGTLEIMVLSARHEQPNRILSLLVEVLAEEFGVDLCPLGSTTFQRAELLKGFEPDSAFYLEHASAVWGREVDPALDPPPDLIIEVDVTSSSLDRFPIFAAFGVPEVWRYDGSRVAIFHLHGGRDSEAEFSRAFPPLRGVEATRLLEDSRQTRSTEWLRRVRDWARQQH